MMSKRIDYMREKIRGIRISVRNKDASPESLISRLGRIQLIIEETNADNFILREKFMLMSKEYNKILTSASDLINEIYNRLTEHNQPKGEN